MKLIIDVPEEDYKGICNLKNEQLRMLPEEVAETLIRISNGVLLDDVKAEIEKHQFSREYCCDHNIDAAIDMSMVRIILNSIGEEVSNK